VAPLTLVRIDRLCRSGGEFSRLRENIPAGASHLYVAKNMLTAGVSEKIAFGELFDTLKKRPKGAFLLLQRQQPQPRPVLHAALES